MKRIIRSVSALACACLLGAACASFALAEDTTLTYNGSTDSFVYGLGPNAATSTDLFDGFKGAMPGDTLTQNITFTNKSSDTDYVDLYLKAIVHDADQNPLTVVDNGSDPDALAANDNFLSQMTIKVTSNGTVISEGPANEAGSLADNVFLGSYEKSKGNKIEVELTIPIEMGNEFQLATGEVDWIFTVEAKDYPPNPVTGDHSGKIFLILGAVVVIGIAGAAVVLIRRRRG